MDPIDQWTIVKGLACCPFGLWGPLGRFIHSLFILNSFVLALILKLKEAINESTISFSK